ncbi:MAG TPA: Sec-independent protein translocase protein TatB [Pseudolabrys sp.]|nr:Sec-independent protein translocase protein TatB [Pseudolabrys sp.]
MFDIGWGELVVIGIVALIAIGPKELPTVLRTLGQYMGKVRRMASEFQGQFQEAMREAELAELKKQAEDLKNSVSDMGNFDPLSDTQKQIESAFDDASKPELPKADAHENANAAEPEPAPAPVLDVALPEPATQVSDKDFATADTPPPKQAGGSA